MLSADQITSIRSAAGAAPLQGPGVAPTSLSDRLGLNAPTDPGYMGRVQASDAAGAATAGQGFKTAATNIGSDFNSYAKSNEGANLPEQVLHGLVFLGHTAGNVASAAGHVIAGSVQAGAAPFTAIKSTTGGGTLGDAMNKNLAQPLGAYISQGVQNVKAAHPGLVDFLHKNPDITKGLMDLFNTVGLAGGGETGLASKIPAVSDAASALKTTVADAASAVPKAIGDVRVSSTAAEAAANAPKSNGIIGTIRSKVATGDVPLMGQNVPENVQTSAARLAQQAPLQGAGAAREATPLDMYNEAANAEQNATADIKNPDAGQKLGTEHITPAFEEVIQMRRDAGKAMQSELDKPEIGGIKTNIAPARQDILDELAKQKLSFDPKEGALTPTGVSRLGKGDRGVIEDYVTALHALGDNPSVEDVNNFIGSQVDDLNLYNNKVGGTTNAERIIQGSLSKLRETISAKATGNSALKLYSEAKAKVAELSKVVDFGTPLVGKKDLSGNYIRDSSVAKRAIQSMADGGSRDFLLALEKHTGKPLLDRAVLTLQAMKDAGNPMGHSLLESVVNQGKDIPLEAQGLGERTVKGLAGYAKSKVVGSPADQTRAFLKSLEKGKK